MRTEGITRSYLFYNTGQNNLKALIPSGEEITFPNMPLFAVKSNKSAVELEHII